MSKHELPESEQPRYEGAVTLDHLRHIVTLLETLNGLGSGEIWERGDTTPAYFGTIPVLDFNSDEQIGVLAQDEVTYYWSFYPGRMS